MESEGQITQKKWKERFAENWVKVFGKLFDKNYAKILDVGGTENTYQLIKHFSPNSEIFSLNIDKKELPKRKNAIVGDAENTPFPDDSFDLIFASETLAHILYPDKFIQEAKRVLKDKGEIIITVPNLNAYHNRVLIFLGYAPTNYTPYPKKTFGVPSFIKPNTHWDCVRVFPYKALKELFNSNGFKLVRMTGINKIGKGKIRFRSIRKLLEFILPDSWKEIIILKASIIKSEKLRNI